MCATLNYDDQPPATTWVFEETRDGIVATWRPGRGAAWAVANLMHPELVDNAVVPVTFDEVIKFYERIYTNYPAYSAENLAKTGTDDAEKAAILKAAKTVHGVFDQKSLMSASGLLMKIMRQFASIYETKQFYLVKNGQVGWISAFVDQSLSNK